MTPDDLTRVTPPADGTRDQSDVALDAGLAAAFGGDTTHLRPPPADPEAGTVIADKYRLIEKVGEGGMGSVWVANQSEPVKRKVAVKLIKAGMDSKAVLARFDAERQALAVMDHPNIAKVLDGGLHDGRPYFVMELVKGVPITTYCDERKLTPSQRLELFVPVCQAIQHAHQKGVIHRDIKPSNVLVALYDDRPVPKVIDFGVAKATGAALTEYTLETGFGAVVGTPTYMSPEQASLNNLDIDTRSDVYSLGVLLYELLTGGPPFSRQELDKKGLIEILRVVREEDPPRPSVKLSTADALPSLAAVRGTEPKALTGLLRSELDWVVMKALEKDRARRYETATGFAADIQRYLAGEPVQAHPPTAAYRLRKFIRRHQGRVVATSAFLTLLLAAVVVSGWLAAQAKQAEAAADRNALAFYGAMLKADAALQEVERTTADQRVDADLAEYKSDPRVGLLQLTRTLRAMPTPQIHRRYPLEGGGEIVLQASDEHLTAQRLLREFVTAAILAAGQGYAPLLPPITHDGHAVTRFEQSPDRRTYFTFGADGTARLWEVRTAKQLALLRREGERVVNGGFSSDGRTVFTDDESGVARFWEADGKYRTQTPPRPNFHLETADRLPRVEGVTTAITTEVPQTPKQIGRNRLLTQRSWSKRSSHPEEGGQFVLLGPDLIELWDTMTGRLVARLDPLDHRVKEFKFVGDGRWVTAVEGPSTVVVFSAEDGKWVARLDHPEGVYVAEVGASPSGRSIATITSDGREKADLRIWDTNSWRASPPIPTRSGQIHFWTDELLGVEVGGGFVSSSLGQIHRFGTHTTTLDRSNEDCLPLLPSGDFIMNEVGQVYDTRTGDRLILPAGRKFHPTVAQFAADGRFAVTSQIVIDMRTDKSFPANWSDMPDLGSRLDIAPDLIELWAQVVVRGELGPDGVFKKWDEGTWEKRRQQLTAVKPPYHDFPFPGHVATDKLHWLRAEFNEARTEPEQLRLASDLLQRAENSGDKAEAVRWREEVRKRTREVLPPPRPAK